MRGLASCIFALMTAGCLYDWTVVPEKPAAVGERCGPTTECVKISYCKWNDGLCGAGGSGLCTKRPDPSSCGNEKIVCACSNGSDVGAEAGECAYAARGVDVRGSCP